MQRVRLRWREIVVIGIGLLALAGPARAKEYGLDDRPGTTVPSLLQVLRLVKDRSPEVLLGNANVATAQSSMVGARLAGLGNPYVEVLGRSAIAGADTSVGFDGTLWLPFEIAGQRGTRIAESEALIGYERKNLEVATALAKAAAVRAYGLAAVGGNRLGVLGELLEVARSEAANYAARFGAGDVTVREAGGIVRRLRPMRCAPRTFLPSWSTRRRRSPLHAPRPPFTAARRSDLVGRASRGASA